MCTTMKELEAQIEAYRSLKALIDEATADFEKCKAEILNYLVANNKTNEIGKDFKVSYSECSKTSYDGAALQNLLGDDISKYQKVTQYTRVNVR